MCIHTGLCKNDKLMSRTPLPCSPAAETAIQPLIDYPKYDDNVSFQGLLKFAPS